MDLERQVNELVINQQSINEQLKILAEAMTSIAVMEERSKSMNETLNGFGKRLNQMEKVLNETVVHVALNGSQATRLSIWLDRVIMMFVGAAMSYALYLFKS